VRVTAEWIGSPDDSRRIQAEHALDDAARYADQAENSIEIAVAALERPPAEQVEERAGVLVTEPVTPREQRLTAEIYRR